MAVHTLLGVTNTLNYWGGRDISSLVSSSATQIIYSNTDGSRTYLIGTGFTVSGGALTAGTITSMERRDSTGATTYETITGLSYAATTFQGHLSESNLDGIFSEILAGADTINGNTLNEFMRAYAGNDTVNGGGGFDTLGYDSSNITGPITVTLSTTSSVTGGATVGTDTLNSIEAVRGTSSGDSFTATTSFSGSNGTFNEFEGLAGNDTITGNGNTRIHFSQATDGVIVTFTAGQSNGSGTASGTGASNVGNDTFSGVAAVRGSNFADVLSAAGASQGTGFTNGFTFDGRSGNDTITGGGTDLRWDFSRATYEFATGAVNVVLGTTNAAGAPKTDIGSVTGDTSVGTDELHDVDQIRGSNLTSVGDTFVAFADFGTDNGAFNEFEGFGGNDTITGNGSTRLGFGTSSGAVTVVWNVGDSLSGTATGNATVGTDTFSGVNSVRGSNSGDTFTAIGAHGSFVFDGRGGNDTINGGQFSLHDATYADIDTVVYTRSTSGVVFALTSTVNISGDSSVGADVVSDVEQFRGSHFNDTFNVTAGFAASLGLLNIFDGGGGNDTISGNGSTRLTFGSNSSSAYGGVDASLATGTAVSILPGDQAGIGSDVFSGVNALEGSRFGDLLTGSDAADAEWFRGRDGADTIDGNGGVRDVVDYENSSQGVVVDLSAGSASNDGFGSSDVLIDIEDVSGSERSDHITGSNLANYLIGGSGDDSLYGGGGDDVIIGDDGFEMYDGKFGTRVASDTGNDSLDGGTGNDTVQGAVGNDTFGGASGSADTDFFFGGDGFDVADYTGALQTVSANLGDTAASGADIGSDALLAVEGVIGGAAVDSLIGNGFANLLNGGAGADFMLGGVGNDTYVVDNTFDLVDEGAVFPAYIGSGLDIDTIETKADWYWDVYSVAERLVIAEGAAGSNGAGTTIVGSIFSGEMVGNSGTNIMFGRGGADTYRAGDGIDYISLSLLGLTEQNAYVGVDGANTIIVEQRQSGAFSYDIVFDFESGKDKLDVSDYAYGSVAEVLALGVDDGAGNSYFVLGDGLDYLYIVGKTVNQLQAGDFLIA